MKKSILFLILCAIAGSVSATVYSDTTEVNVCKGDTILLTASRPSTLPSDYPQYLNTNAYYKWWHGNSLSSSFNSITGALTSFYNAGVAGNSTKKYYRLDVYYPRFTINNGDTIYYWDTIRNYFHMNVRITYPNATQTVSACDSYTWINGVTYTSNNTEDKVTLKTTYGCDSIVRLNLTIGHSSNETLDTIKCDSVYWYGQTYMKTGTYEWNQVDGNGCLHRRTLNITINKSSSFDTLVTGCDNVTFGTIGYSTDGDPVLAAGTNIAGCDSTVKLHIRIRNSSSTLLPSVTACDSFYFSGQTYTTGGAITNHFTNSVGCDSTVTLNLTINSSTHTDTSITTCDSYRWSSVTNTTYTNSGSYYWMGTNPNGCPNTKTLNLTIKHSSTMDTTVNNCGSASFMGTNYTQSGNHIITLNNSNAVGCDSIIHLHVQVRKNSPDTTVSQSACDSFYYAGFGQLYHASTTDTRTFKNIAGCDSTVTLNLTIYHPAQAIVPVTMCNSYTWPRNGHTYYSSSTTDSIRGGKDGHNCDSIIHLNLTINHSVNSTETVPACDNYLWYGNNYTMSGTYLHDTLSATSHCRDTATLVLTIRHPRLTTSTVAECEKYSWHGMNFEGKMEIDTVYRYPDDDSVCWNADTLHLTIYGTKIPDTTRTLIRKGNTDSPWMLIYPRDVNDPEYHYWWYRDGERIEGARKQYLVLPFENVPQGVTYSVLVSDAEVQLCSSTYSATFNHTGKGGEGTVDVYPNPSHGQFSVSLKGEEADGTARVLTQTGVEMLRFEVRNGWADVTNTLPAGSYILQVTTPSGNQFTDRLVVY